MIQFGFYSQPKIEKVLVVLSDNHEHKVNYIMELTFRCDDPLPLEIVEKTKIPDAITANITNITSGGNVTITFSTKLKIPKVNLTEFPSLNVTVQGKVVPVLELSIIS